MSLITVRLDKGNSPNLGFRLQGGKDFGTPLVIQKVNGGSPAERAGLSAGDSVIKINTTDVFNLRHKDAQDVIIRAGPSFEVTVQRGGSVWKPSVVPTGPLSNASPTVTKTSLAATKQDNFGSVGTGHNLSAKPFSPQLNGAVNGGPKLVNNQYNSPLKLYSEESIAETLSAQTEVLSTGALGVNFKKNEKSYDATNSAVYRMLQEAEKEPKSPEPAEPETTVSPSATTGLRHVAAPENRPAPAAPQLPPGQNICADCERLIVGVFVRIKDKNLHVECFKCSTCGTSLKNVGYYNINNKLYCDVHAKLAARTNPPAPNLVPVTVPPGGKAPANAISSALASHSLPSPSPLSPKGNLAQPFQPSQDDRDSNLATPLQNLSLNLTSEPNYNSNKLSSLNNSTPLSFNKYLNKAGNFSSAPKPFSSVSAPISSSPNYNTLPKAAPAAAPLSPVVSAPAQSFSPASSAGRSVYSFVWPPPPEEPEGSAPTACPLYVPPATHIKVIPKPKRDNPSEITELNEQELEEIAMYQQPKMSLCSEEVCELTGRRSAAECIETITETLETQRLVESVMKSRPRSPPPLPVLEPLPQPTLPKVCEIKEGELRKPTDFTPNTIECKLKSQVENSVPQSWESPMVQALRTIPDVRDDPFKKLPTTKFSSTGLASALSIAPSEPFNPQPLCSEPVPLPEETVPYFPPEHPLEIEKREPKPEKPDSMFVKALQTAPDRPFTPAGAPVQKKKKDPADELFKDIPKPQAKLSMRDALTTASERPYSPFVPETAKVETVKEPRRENLQKVMKPPVLPPSFHKPVEDKPQAPKPFPISIYEKREEKEIDVKTSSSKVIEKHKTESTVEECVESVEEEKNQGMYPLFKGFSCSFENKSEHSQFKIEISTTPPIINVDGSQTPTVKVSRTGASTESITETLTEETKKHEKMTEQKKIEKQAEQVQFKKPLPLASALQKPEKLPQYQINLSDNLLLEENLQIKQKIEDGRAEKAKVLPPPKPPREVQTKPVIMIQPGESNLSPEQSFKPVVEERAPNLTFSPRPRPVTPSMINKPPPVIPYYQANLVAQEFKAPEVNLLDPGSPNISRSPSPCPDRGASPLPPFKQGLPRPKSPAAGPPPNPLATGEPLPKPKNAKMEQAKRNVSSFIPQYKEKMEMVEKAPQMYSMQVEAQNPTFQRGVAMFEGKSVEDSMKAQIVSEQIGQATVSTAMLEQSHSAHLEQMRKSQSQSVETEGAVQIQRKKTVTEEFEHSQKSKMVQIERNVTQPFKNVKNLEEQAMMGMHVTNPQPIVSPFLKHGPQQAIQCPKPDCAQQSCSKSECGACPRTQPFKHVPSPSSTAPIKHVLAPSGSGKPTQSVNKPNVPLPNAGAGSGGGRQAGAVGVAPKRGRGVLNAAALTGARIPLCASCHSQIRYKFLANLNKETQRSSIFMQVGENNPGYGQINITIPVSTSPQLDSKGSSPRSDYSSQSSSSSKNPSDSAREKFLQELRANEPHSALYSQVSKPKPTKLFTTSEQNTSLPDNLTFTNQPGELITDNNNTKPPVCCHCNNEIVRGPFITALGKIWCPEHFICATPSCRRPLQDLGFVEEQGQLYCEYCFEQYLAPPCAKCGSKIKGDCLKAIGKNFHPECFCCFYCGKLFGNSPFFLEDGSPYCEADWNELFTTKCFACGFPVEAGDRWVEALNNNYHSQCFNCTMCKKNLEGQSFFAKGGRPFCKNHAR